eukprot:Nk52_evm67s745 gene=Nk52_evmTU67s745
MISKNFRSFAVFILILGLSGPFSHVYANPIHAESSEESEDYDYSAEQQIEEILGDNSQAIDSLPSLNKIGSTMAETVTGIESAIEKGTEEFIKGTRVPDMMEKISASVFDENDEESSSKGHGRRSAEDEQSLNATPLATVSDIDETKKLDGAGSIASSILSMASNQVSEKKEKDGKEAAVDEGEEKTNSKATTQTADPNTTTEIAFDPQMNPKDYYYGTNKQPSTDQVNDKSNAKEKRGESDSISLVTQFAFDEENDGSEVRSVQLDELQSLPINVPENNVDNDFSELLADVDTAVANMFDASNPPKKRKMIKKPNAASMSEAQANNDKKVSSKDPSSSVPQDFQMEENAVPILQNKENELTDEEIEEEDQERTYDEQVQSDQEETSLYASDSYVEEKHPKSSKLTPDMKKRIIDKLMKRLESDNVSAEDFTQDIEQGVRNIMKEANGVSKTSTVSTETTGSQMPRVSASVGTGVSNSYSNTATDHSSFKTTTEVFHSNEGVQQLVNNLAKVPEQNKEVDTSFEEVTPEISQKSNEVTESNLETPIPYEQTTKPDHDEAFEEAKPTASEAPTQYEQPAEVVHDTAFEETTRAAPEAPMQYEQPTEAVHDTAFEETTPVAPEVRTQSEQPAEAVHDTAFEETTPVAPEVRTQSEQPTEAVHDTAFEETTPVAPEVRTQSEQPAEAVHDTAFEEATPDALEVRTKPEQPVDVTPGIAQLAVKSPSEAPQQPSQVEYDSAYEEPSMVADGNGVMLGENIVNEDGFYMTEGDNYEYQYNSDNEMSVDDEPESEYMVELPDEEDVTLLNVAAAKSRRDQSGDASSKSKKKGKKYPTTVFKVNPYKYNEIEMKKAHNALMTAGTEEQTTYATDVEESFSGYVTDTLDLNELDETANFPNLFSRFFKALYWAWMHSNWKGRLMMVLIAVCIGYVIYTLTTDLIKFIKSLQGSSRRSDFQLPYYDA